MNTPAAFLTSKDRATARALERFARQRLERRDDVELGKLARCYAHHDLTPGERFMVDTAFAIEGERLRAKQDARVETQALRAEVQGPAAVAMLRVESRATRPDESPTAIEPRVVGRAA